MTEKINKGKRSVVNLNPNTYQPNKAELDIDLRVHSTINWAVKSLVASAEVKCENK